MTLRWGIIGCGDVAEFKGGPALQRAPGSALVAVMRRDAALAADFARRFQVPRHYSTVAELLADPEVDAVYVATPVHLHYEHTLAAAAAGKHVLVEKPLALDGTQGHEMLAACDAAGVALGVAYYRRFYPVVLRLRELLAAGTLGQLVQAQALFGSYYSGHPGDGRGGWRTAPELSGGGALADVGSHRLDLLLHLLGPVAHVSALATTQAHSYAAEDGASLLLQFRSGAHGLVGIYWNMRPRVDRLELAGTEGRVVVSDLEAGILELHRHGESPQREVLPPPRPTHLGLVADFVACVGHGQPPAASGQTGLATTQLLDAAYLAARENRSVALP